MTFKAIVENLIIEDAKKWIENLMEMSGYGKPTDTGFWYPIEWIKNKDEFIYSFEAEVYTAYYGYKVKFDGTVDDLNGIKHNSIKLLMIVDDTIENLDKFIWFEKASDRIDYNIENFSLT